MRTQPIGNDHVHLSGIITNERFREAAIVAAENVSGVTRVHGHLCWVEPTSRVVPELPRRRGVVEKRTEMISGLARQSDHDEKKLCIAHAPHCG